MTFSHPLLKAITGSLLGLGFVAAAHAQTAWDMPTPYPASNFHTENIQQFANEVDAATGYDTKSWEQLSHYYDIQAWLPKNIVFVSKKAFDALDQPARDALLKAAAAAEERGWKVSEEKTAWYVEQLKANKMQVQPAPEALQAELLKVGEKMTAEWVEKAGPDGQAILDAYRKLK